MKKTILSCAVVLALIFTFVSPITANAAAYITLEQAESIAVEAAKELNPIFSEGHTYNDMINSPEINITEQFYTFWFYYYPPNSTQSHAEEELFIFVGETSGNVYYGIYPSRDWEFYKQYSSLQKLPASWESAYRDILNTKRNDILGHFSLGRVALKDVNSDSIPELFFVAATGNPAGEADLMVYTYYNGGAVLLFSSTANVEAQMSPRAIPFMSGGDFWIWIFNPTESGITEEYRRYTLSGGVLTLAQTIPVEYRLFTEPDEMPDYERIAPQETAALDRLIDKQSRNLFENDAMETGYYSAVYSSIAERSPSVAPTITESPAQSGKTVNATASKVFVNGAEKSFEAYNINGSNYFKLRDIAMVLNGTSKPFEVGYDNNTKAITMTSGQPYTPTGGEMAAGDGQAKPATPTASKIYLDGNELSFTVYNIGGSNFFKLVDLMSALNIGITYNQTNGNISIDTNVDHTGVVTVR